MDEATTEAATGRSLANPEANSRANPKPRISPHKEETIARVLAYFLRNPTKDAWAAASALGLSRSTVNHCRSYLINTNQLPPRRRVGARERYMPKEGT